MNKALYTLCLFLHITFFPSQTTSTLQLPNFEIIETLIACYSALADLAEATASYEEAKIAHTKKQSITTENLLQLAKIDLETASTHYARVEKKYFKFKKEAPSSKPTKPKSSCIINLNNLQELEQNHIESEKPTPTQDHLIPVWVTREEVQLPKTLVPRPGILCLRPQSPIIWR